ncbi:MAG TPA: hypothetical protein VHQ45_14855 [Gemmatimonadaceae bacterium]|nr:hypothetical protein [Gemmatimonadaceae bacterium]
MALLGACRGDSITMPVQATEAVCYDVVCAQPMALAPDSPIVIQPLEDAVERLVPTVSDPRMRNELGQLLGTLRRDLIAGRLPAARIGLAHAYEWIERTSPSLDDGRVPVGSPALDPADLVAIRLALVPAAGALGASAR